MSQTLTHRPTRPMPVLTTHARARCAEMGLSTRIAKAIVRDREVTYAGDRRHQNNAMIALCSAHPDYAVVFDPTGEVEVIVTVLFRTENDYDRAGATFTVRENA